VISYFSKLLAKWGETIFYGSIIGFNVDQLREADNILCDTQTKPAVPEVHSRQWRKSFLRE